MRKISVILLNVIALSAFAANKDLCHIQLNVLNDSAVGQRQALLNEAFTKVSLRVSGQTSVLQNTELHNRPESDLLKLVKNYAYKFQDNKQIFDVAFDYAEVKKKLVNSGVAVLPENRPYTILWLASAEQGNEPVIVSSSALTPLTKMLEQKSSDFGLPVILPLLDFADTMAVEVQDILDVNQGVLAAISKKYSAQNILVGRLNFADGLWQVHVTLLNYPDATWTLTNDSLEKVCDMLFNNMAVAIIHSTDTIATQAAHVVTETNNFQAIVEPIKSNPTESALVVAESVVLEIADTQTPLAAEDIKTGKNKVKAEKAVLAANVPAATIFKEPKQLALHIYGIDDLGKYATIIAYLRRIDGVSEVEVAELGEDSALFTIESAISIKDLTGIIAKDQFLTAASTISQGNEMRFILSS